jgi:hypothetical protein
MTLGHGVAQACSKHGILRLLMAIEVSGRLDGPVTVGLTLLPVGADLD